MVKQHACRRVLTKTISLSKFSSLLKVCGASLWILAASVEAQTTTGEGLLRMGFHSTVFVQLLGVEIMVDPGQWLSTEKLLLLKSWCVASIYEIGCRFI